MNLRRCGEEGSDFGEKEMLLGSRTKLWRQEEIGRFTFELLDYEWDVGSEVYEVQPDAVLRWRVEPRKLQLPGRIGRSGTSHFGQLMLLPPEMPLESSGPAREAERCHVVACRYNPQWLEETTGLCQGAMRDDICISLSNPHLEYAMRRLWTELSCPGFANTILTEGLAIAMAADLACHLMGMKKPEQTGGMLTRRQIDLIADYLAEESHWPLSVSALSSMLGVSDTHFRRLFRATTGQTIHSYVEEFRLDKAKLLLATTKLPLKIISYRLGFAHPSAFSAAFSKLAGESPRAFRKNNHGVAALRH
jgi:AraC family transcriptional regulator